MKKYIPLDFDEKGKVVLGREKNTPTPNGTIPAIFIPGGSDEGKQGLKSISISPAITTTPALDSMLPLDYDELIAQGYQPSENGDITINVTVSSELIEEQYTITATPTSGWYAQNCETGDIGERGETVTYNLELSDGDTIACVYEKIGAEPPVKTILVMVNR